MKKEVNLTIEENDLYFILELLKSIAGNNAYKDVRDYILALVDYLQDLLNPMYAIHGELS